MELKLNNLDDVQRFIEEELPEWSFRRGKRTHITESHRPHDNYEVIQLFRPNEFGFPFAEFWKGYYDFSPDSYDGHVGTNFWGFTCHGDLEFAMRDVIRERDRLNMCPKLCEAVKVAAHKDKMLRLVYRAISYDDISSAEHGAFGVYWAIECDKFSCASKQRCCMVVMKGENENTFVVRYRLETLCNDCYKVTHSAEIVAEISSDAA